MMCASAPIFTGQAAVASLTMARCQSAMPVQSCRSAQAERCESIVSLLALVLFVPAAECVCVRVCVHVWLCVCLGTCV
mgnify:FL=1